MRNVGLKIDYCIASIKGKYRGMERIIDSGDLYLPETKKAYDTIIEEYFMFLVQETENSHNEEFLKKEIEYAAKLKGYGIKCEVIVYSDTMLSCYCGYELGLLGIDIVHDMCESLLSKADSPFMEQFVNENGLCDTVEAAETIIPFLDHGEVLWEPCFVYKIMEYE